MRSYESGTGERGATTTATATMLLVTLLTSAGIALTVADKTLMNSTEYKRHTAGLMLAESAVEDAMAHLDDTDDWSTLTLPMEDFTAPHAVGGGMAWADVKNDLRDSGGAKDTNGMVLIKGYGQMLNSSYVENIEVLYWRPSFVIPPVAGVIVCGADIVDANGGSMKVDGYNHYLPMAPCSGSLCNPVRNGLSPDVAGMAFENAGHESDTGMSLPGNIDGVPVLASGVCTLQGPSGLCSRTRMLARNLDRLVGMETLTEWPIKGRGSYGTVADPKLIRVADGTELRLSGTTQGAGVLFVDGTLDQVGTFTWTGLIVVGAGGKLSLRGTANIFGSLITAGSSSDVAILEMKGSPTIAWAADAINIGPFNMPGLMSSWREFR